MIWLTVTYRANISAALEIMPPSVFLAHQNSAYTPCYFTGVLLHSGELPAPRHLSLQFLL